MNKIELIIEKGEDGKLWGRVNYEDNLIAESANSLSTLEKKMLKLLKDFHGIENPAFAYSYDVSAFFENFSFLNQTKIAELSGINAGLLRQYASGVKNPSQLQAKKIETAIHKLATKLQSVTIFAE